MNEKKWWVPLLPRICQICESNSKNWNKTAKESPRRKFGVKRGELGEKKEV